MDLSSEDILNIKNPNRELKEHILTREAMESGREWSHKAKEYLLHYPFENVRAMISKVALYSSISSDQVTEELFENIFNPQKSNVILPKYVSKVHCGFISPAEDYKEGYLSLNEKFVKNPASTFPVEAEGDCMRETIFDGDILLVDQSLDARHDDIVLAVIDGEFTMKRLVLHRGKMILRPDNPLFHDILIHEGMRFEIRGVVTSIHRHLRYKKGCD